MKVVRGSSIEKAIKVSKKESDINRVSIRVENSDSGPPVYASFDSIIKVLDMLFSPYDGDYFIISETNIIHNNSKYKVFYIEDKDNEKHQIFFKMEE